MDFGTAFASAWSTGISVYGVAALLGIAGRAGWVDSPEALERWPVIAITLALFVVEFVADKIPLVDSVWDAIHTVIRPLAGAALMVGAVDSGNEIALALAGGGAALSAHAAKATTRALVNTSPEPFSNAIVSFTEDGVVAGLMALAIAFPEVALVVTVVFVVASIVVAVALLRFVARVRRRLRTGGLRRVGPPG
jgi:hypothetical protein